MLFSQNNENISPKRQLQASLVIDMGMYHSDDGHNETARLDCDRDKVYRAIFSGNDLHGTPMKLFVPNSEPFLHYAAQVGNVAAVTVLLDCGWYDFESTRSWEDGHGPGMQWLWRRTHKEGAMFWIWPKYTPLPSVGIPLHTLARNCGEIEYGSWRSRRPEPTRKHLKEHMDTRTNPWPGSTYLPLLGLPESVQYSLTCTRLANPCHAPSKC